MSSKKNGFTLTELIAVIIIMSIIALITVPVINNIIEDSKKRSFESSVGMLLNAIEIHNASIDFKQNVEYVYQNKKLYYIDYVYDEGLGLDVPTEVLVKTKGVIDYGDGTFLLGNGIEDITFHISDGNYCATSGVDEEIVLSEGECTLIINNDTSGASSPELTTGMIPVKWNGTAWVKADVNNEAGVNQWYDYNTKEWANAVTVTSTNRTTHMNSAAGSIIPISDINTMWVWIPRYKYAIPSGTGARQISIVFEPKTTAKSTGNAIDTNYRTHPAFTFGTTEVSGIWVGKFETTGTIASPTILPNTAALRSQTVKAMYDSSRAMQNNATYGTSTDGNIHMARNEEWGAVAYLSHSQYGINSEIYKNNSGSYYTGRSGGNVGGSQVLVGANEYINTGFYTYDGKCATTVTLAPGIASECTAVDNNLTDKTRAYKASTTGNIYGVYDMSGGSYEYTLSMYRPTDTTSVTDNSGFGATTTTGTLPTSEYWNRYTTTSTATACSGGICYGNALSETSGWYSDGTSLVNSVEPWAARGGAYGSTTSPGIFYYGRGTGTTSSSTSFRIIQLKP